MINHRRAILDQETGQLKYVFKKILAAVLTRCWQSLSSAIYSASQQPSTKVLCRFYLQWQGAIQSNSWQRFQICKQYELARTTIRYQNLQFIYQPVICSFYQVSYPKLQHFVLGLVEIVGSYLTAEDQIKDSEYILHSLRDKISQEKFRPCQVDT